jgi:hypothetical protein
MTGLGSRTAVWALAAERRVLLDSCLNAALPRTGGSGQLRTLRQLLNHLVGAGQEQRRHRQVNRLGRRRIDNKLQLARLHDRELGGLLTLEDPAHVGPLQT